MTPNSKADNANAQQMRMIRDVIEVVLLVAVIFFSIKLSVESRPISGISMQPGLADSQLVMVNKLSYVFGSPQRGDVIIFYYPLDQTQVFIKRIIGLPGDTIQINAKTVAVDGHTLDEPYISSADNCAVAIGDCTARSIKLGPSQYWVMGDNRPNSDDSRTWGTLDRKLIIGKAEFVWWPTNSAHGIDTHRQTFANISDRAPSGSVPAEGVILAPVLLAAMVPRLSRRHKAA